MSNSRDDPAASSHSTGRSSVNSSVHPDTSTNSLVDQLENFRNLILTRQEGETVVFSVNGTPVARVTMVRKGGGKLRLAFESSPIVDIDREEVYIDKLSRNEKLNSIQKELISLWLNSNSNKRKPKIRDRWEQGVVQREMEQGTQKGTQDQTDGQQDSGAE